MHAAAMRRSALIIALVGMSARYLPSALAQPSTCAEAKSAQQIVDVIAEEQNAGTSTALFNVDTEPKLYTAVRYLYTKFTAKDTGFNTNLYVGVKDDSFYIIKNCWREENMRPDDANDYSTYCQQAGDSQYLVFLRNNLAKGTSKIFIHPLDEAGYMREPIVHNNNTFALASTRWYAQAVNEWSTTFKTAGALSSTWVKNILGPQKEFHATVAADWTENENCITHCNANSAATKMVADFQAKYSALRAKPYNVPGNSVDQTDRIYLLYQAMTQSNNGYGSFLWYADEDPNGDYYAIEDCQQAPQAVIWHGCVAGGTRYIAYVMPRNSEPTLYKYTPGAALESKNVFKVDKSAGLASWTSLTQASYWKEATIDGLFQADEKAVKSCTENCLMQRHYSKKISVGSQNVARVGSQRFSTEPCADSCKANSATFKVVNTAAGKVKSFLEPITTPEMAFKRLEDVARMFIDTNQGSSEVFYWGSKDSSEFVGIQNCFTADSITNAFTPSLESFCQNSAAGQYVGYVYAKNAFADGIPRVYAINADGKIASDGAGNKLVIFSDNNNKGYNYKSNFKYYTDGLVGWGAEEKSFGSSNFMKYIRPVYRQMSEIGTVGGIRTVREPCHDGCQENSYAVKATRQVANEADLEAWAEISSVDGIAKPVGTLTKAMQDSDRGSSVCLYAGVQKKDTQGDLYRVCDCYTNVNVFNENRHAEWCIKAGSSVKYIAMVRVQKVFGNAMQIYRVYSDGTLGDRIGTDDDALNVEKTEFWQYQEKYGGGWTPTEAFKSGQLYSTYILPKWVVSGPSPSLSGVIAADMVYMNDPSTCSNACIYNSYAFPIAYSLYHGWSSSQGLQKASITTNVAENELIKVLISALEDNDRGYNNAVNYLENCAGAAETCNFYSVINCRSTENENGKWCVAAGPLAQYVVTMRNFLLHQTTDYKFRTATIAGTVSPTDLGVESPTVYGTHGALELFRASIFGLVPGSGSKKFGPGSSLIGTAGSYVIPIGTTGYVAVAISAAAPCYDKCKRNSFATKAVRMGAAAEADGGISPARFDRVEDMATIKLALQNVLDVMLKVDYGNNVMLFLGTRTDDFYGIKNCYIAPTLLADPACKDAVQSGYQYVAYVRNTDVFGDAKRRIYAVRHQPSFGLFDSANKEVTDKLQHLGVTPSDYPTTERSWFKLRAGWTSIYGFASGGLGITYAMPFYDASGNNLLGVVAADKYGGESCYEPCTRNSYVIPTVRSLVANGKLDMFASTDSQQTMQNAISAIHTAYNANNQGTNNMVYFGMEGGDYYGVKNCRSASTDQDKFCSDPVATARLLAHLKNEAAYGDKNVHVFQISDTGSVGGTPVGKSMADMDTVKEPFYSTLAKSGQQSSWVFDKSYGEFPTPVSYAYKITNTSDVNLKTTDKLIGVAGASRFATEPCRSQCLYSSYAMSSTLDFITKSADELGAVVNNEKGVSAMIKLLWQSFQSSDHGDNVQLMYVNGATGDFYAIRNCWLPGNVNDKYCSMLRDAQGKPNVWTIAIVKNEAVYKKGLFHVFAIDRETPAAQKPKHSPGQVTNPTGKIDASTKGLDYLGTEDLLSTTHASMWLNFKVPSVDMTQSTWYKQQSGWGKVYDLSDGSVGQTYSVPVTVPVTKDGVRTPTQIGVVAAIRTEQEECFSGDDQDVPSIRVRVRTLDTVETIAKEYGYSWTELLLMNPLLKNPNDLKPKTYLYNALLYVVREGDTLYSIASKYGISWQQLAGMNPQIPQIKGKLAWQERQSGDPGGFPYYYNLQTREAQWEKPAAIVEAEKTDLKIFVGQKLAVRPNLEELVCQNKYYSAKATMSLGR